MKTIIKSVREKVIHLKNNTDELIVKIEVKTPLDEAMKR